MNVSPPNSAIIRSDEWSVQPTAYPQDMGSTKGTYVISAIPEAGYQFVEWNIVETVMGTELTTTITVPTTAISFDGKPLTATAIQELIPEPEPEPEPEPVTDVDVDVEVEPQPTFGCFINTIK